MNEPIRMLRCGRLVAGGDEPRSGCLRTARQGSVVDDRIDVTRRPPKRPPCLMFKERDHLSADENPRHIDEEPRDLERRRPDTRLRLIARPDRNRHAGSRNARATS
jgi:hypothetical protein